MKLFHHPISSYSQKVMMAFEEKGVGYEPMLVDLMSPEKKAEYKKQNPLGKVPMLVLDDGWKIPESSAIVEWLDTHHATGAKLFPDDKDGARRARFFERLSDLYLNDTMTVILFDGWKPPEKRDPERVAHARATIDTMYGMMNEGFAKKPFALGDTFSVAECATAPALFYLKNMHPYDAHPHVAAYAERLFARPSWQKVQSLAMPYLAKLMGKG